MIAYPYLDKWVTDHGMTQRQFAEFLGIDKSTVNKIMNGRNDMSKSTIDLILEKTGMKYERAFATSTQQ